MDYLYAPTHFIITHSAKETVTVWGIELGSMSTILAPPSHAFTPIRTSISPSKLILLNTKVYISED